MEGESITKIIDEQMTLKDIEKSDTAIWNLFYFTGYLTTRKEELKEGRYECEMVIPNKEVKMLYTQIIKNWFRDEMGRHEYDSFLQSLLDENVEEFTQNLSDFLIFSTSFYDFGKNGTQEKEKSYHLLFLGFIASLRETHIIHSNKESGLGRYDILIIPKSKSKDLGFIIEFKRSDKANEDLEILARSALKQIDMNLYLSEIQQYEHIKRVLKLGFAFKGKEVKSVFEMIELAKKKE